MDRFRLVHRFVFLLVLLSLTFPVAQTDANARGRDGLSHSGQANGDSWNMDLVGRWISGRARSIAVKDSIAYVGVTGGLIVIDCSSSDAPVELASLPLTGWCVTSGYATSTIWVCQEIAISGQYAYIANGYAGLRVVDISNPAAPAEVGFYDTPEAAHGVTVNGGYAYVADCEGGLRLIDVSDPATPVEAGSYSTVGLAMSVAVSGDYLCVTESAKTGYPREGLGVIDISNPAAPAEVGFYHTQYPAYGITVSGDYAYVANLDDGLLVIDISNPAAPTEVGFADSYNTKDVAVSGNYAYVAAQTRFRVFDISTPAAPLEVADRGSNNCWFMEVAVSDSLVYLANGGRGLWVRDVSDPSDPVIVGRYATGDQAIDVAVSGDYAYVGNGWDGLRVIDISNPANPVSVGRYDTFDIFAQEAGRIALSDDYVFVTVEFNGFRVIDVSNPAAPSEVGFYDPGNSTYEVAVSGGYAYVAQGYDGLALVDISAPAAPVEVGSYISGGLIVGVSVSGSYAYVAEGNSGGIPNPEDFRVIDVSNPVAPFEVGSYGTGGRWGAWKLTVSGDHAYVACRSDGLRIIDVSNPAAPFEVAMYDTTDTAEGVVVHGNYAYVAHSDYGIRVLDVTNPASPQEEAFYDTWDAWTVAVDDNYIYVADSDNGLHILEHTQQTPTMLQAMRTHALPGAVRVVWEVVEDSDITGYLIDRRSGENTRWRRLTSSPIPAEGRHRYEYIDRNVQAGKGYTYRLSVLTIDDEVRTLGEEHAEVPAPAKLTLEQNCPNPFNPNTAIRFSLPEASAVNLSIYDLTGRHVATVFKGKLEAGVWTRRWDGRNDHGQAVSSGVYVYRLQAGKQTQSGKMVLVR